MYLIVSHSDLFVRRTGTHEESQAHRTPPDLRKSPHSPLLLSTPLSNLPPLLPMFEIPFDSVFIWALLFFCILTEGRASDVARRSDNFKKTGFLFTG